MAGGRRTTKSVEAAAAAGPQASLRSCSAASTTKRKLASGKEEAAASASGRTRRPRASSGGSKAKEKTAVAEDEVAEAQKTVKQKRRMPAKDVRYALTREPRAPPERYEALKRRNPELVPLPGEEDDEKLVRLYVVARAFYELEEKFPKYQDWVRGELKSKGYVEVDDDYFKHKAEAQAVLDREWPKIRAKMDQLCVTEGGCGDESESESDEEEGEDE